MAERPWKFESSRPHHLIHRRGIAHHPPMAGAPATRSCSRSASSASSCASRWSSATWSARASSCCPRDLAPLGWNSVYGWLVTIAGTLCLVVVLARLARDAADGCGAFLLSGRGVRARAPASSSPGATGSRSGSTNATLAVAVVSNLSIIWPGLGAPGRRRARSRSAWSGCSPSSTAWASGRRAGCRC